MFGKDTIKLVVGVALGVTLATFIGGFIFKSKG